MFGKSYYIQQISKMSNRGGDKLLELLDRYNKIGLKYITPEEAEEFYWDLINRDKNEQRKEALAKIKIGKRYRFSSEVGEKNKRLSGLVTDIRDGRAIIITNSHDVWEISDVENLEECKPKLKKGR